VTHVKLAIFPDGGVARLRVHGEVAPRWSRLSAFGGPIDLAALEHGAIVESCSDMFFGSRTNLIKPGPSRSMADGWETRRRRGPGNDWAIVRLAAAGTIERLEIDTSHFKGNAPGRCTVEGIDAGPPAGPPDPAGGRRPARRLAPAARLAAAAAHAPRLRRAAPRRAGDPPAAVGVPRRRRRAAARVGRARGRSDRAAGRARPAQRPAGRRRARGAAP